MFDVPFKLHIYHDFNERIFVDASVILIVVCSSALLQVTETTLDTPFRATCE